MKEWMPENPIGGGFKVSAGQHWAWDKGSIAGAKAVLVEIKNRIQHRGFVPFYEQDIEQMIKELEGMK